MREWAETERNPVRFINILRRYGRADYGSVFLYFPKPCRPDDAEAHAWLSMLKAMGAARRQWIAPADQVLVLLQHTHPHLFEPSPVCFEVYRLDQTCLDRIFSRL